MLISLPSAQLETRTHNQNFGSWRRSSVGLFNDGFSENRTVNPCRRYARYIFSYYILHSNACNMPQWQQQLQGSARLAILSLFVINIRIELPPVARSEQPDPWPLLAAIKWVLLPNQRDRLGAASSRLWNLCKHRILNPSMELAPSQVCWH